MRGFITEEGVMEDEAGNKIAGDASGFHTKTRSQQRTKDISLRLVFLFVPLHEINISVPLSTAVHGNHCTMGIL
jgi:hypothetical protein